MIGGNGITLRRFLLALVFDGAGGRSQRGQFLARHQHRRLAGGHVHVIERSVFAAVVALHEGNFGAVGTPLHVLRTAAEYAAGLEDLFNRQLFFRVVTLAMKGMSGLRKQE